VRGRDVGSFVDEAQRRSRRSSNLPKSQCFECDPSLKQKFAVAYKEKYGKEPPAGGDEKHEHNKK
jgi:hypothetical protein